MTNETPAAAAARTDGRFKVVAPYRPAGDQPQAIAALDEGLRSGDTWLTLRGATGTGKTFTVANLIAAQQRPTLVIAPNKTLAAQLAAELRSFLPENAVELFISYYDFYQPEAYLPASDTFIDKEATINEEIDSLRHRATVAALTRRDVVVVASVSCIYGLGDPAQYGAHMLTIASGQQISRDSLILDLVSSGFTRNDAAPSPGTFRVRGDVLDVADLDGITRIELDLDIVHRITRRTLTGENVEHVERSLLAPRSHYVSDRLTIEAAVARIGEELDSRLAELDRAGKKVEAHRLRQRTMFDIESLRELGFCRGVENYSAHLDGRSSGQPPFTLLDYFDEDWLCIVDESHVTLPQLRGMFAGDRARKDTLVEHGFRLPSARDNRPLTFEEFEQRINQVVCLSATPADLEIERSSSVVEQLVRPTGILDPTVEVRPSSGQIEDLVTEAAGVVSSGGRVLVTALTKRLAELVAESMDDRGVPARFLHSDLGTMERSALLRDLREGRFDVLVGVNLLREGLDLPEVALVAVLDADREGFLRSSTALIQTMGRAARNLSGHVLLYADRVTPAMRSAMDETARRRRTQEAYNSANGVTPHAVTSARPSADLQAPLTQGGAWEDTPLLAGSCAAEQGTSQPPADQHAEMPDLAEMERKMVAAAEALEFERAAELRDEIASVRKTLEGTDRRE